MSEFYIKDSIIAIKSLEDEFYIGQCEEDIPFKSSSSRKYQILWFERSESTKEGIILKKSYSDKIYPKSILCQTTLSSKSHSSYLLTLENELNILKAVSADRVQSQDRERSSRKALADISHSAEKNENVQKIVECETQLINPSENISFSLDITELKSNNLSENTNRIILDICNENVSKEGEKEMSNEANTDELYSFSEPLASSSQLENTDGQGFFIEPEYSQNNLSIELDKCFLENSNLTPESSASKSRIYNETNTDSSYVPSTEITGSDTDAQPSIKLNETNFSHANISSESSLEKGDSVTIKCSLKREGKRIYDKRHVCYYCNKSLCKITRHLTKIHKNELEVARILSLTDLKEKKEGFLCILRAGDYYHNCNVLTLKEGQLILSRRPNKQELKFLSYNNYGPCPKCLGFMITDNLWFHLKYNCPKQDQEDKDKFENKKRDVRGESLALIMAFKQIPDDFVKNIINSLRSDPVTDVIKNEKLILQFGHLLYQKYSNQQYDHLRQTLRQVARLLMEIRKINSDCHSLDECILPEHFDDIIAAVNVMCMCSRDQLNSRSYGVPTLALKLGHSLKKCALIARGQAIRKGQLSLDKKISGFLELMSMEWSIRISAGALMTLKKNKLNSIELLPLTEDLIKLNNYLDEKIKFFCDNFETEYWFQLAKMALTRIILFNKRRPGEVSKMTLEQYSTRPDLSEENRTVLEESLTPLEKNLARRLTLVEVIGKSRALFKVPVLLTQHTKKALDILIQYRSSVTHISPNNIYIFARGNLSQNFLRGTDCLRTICDELQLQKPNLITGTKLRKYIATVVQVFDLKEVEYDWLARHLGHDIRVHRNYYRLHESTLELAKVSRLLLASDKGRYTEFKGKQLNEINIDDLPDVENEDSEQSENDDIYNKKSVRKCKNQTKGKRDLQKVEMADDSDLSDEDNDEYITAKKYKKPIEKGSKRKYGSTNKKVSSIVKQTWTTEEIKAVTSFFSKNIKASSVPGKKDCELCLQRYVSELKHRKWKDIKYYVKNYITRLKKNNLNIK